MYVCIQSVEKKRKHYIIFNNRSTFKDEHFKLTDYLDLLLFNQLIEIHNFAGTITSCFLSSCKGTHKTKSHKKQYVMSIPRTL